MKKEADLTEVGIVTSVAKITADPLLPVLPQSDVLTADLARLRLLLILSAPSPALFPVLQSIFFSVLAIPVRVDLKTEAKQF